MNNTRVIAFVFLAGFPGLTLSQEVMTASECLEYGQEQGYHYTDAQKKQLLDRIEQSNEINSEIQFYGRAVDPSGHGLLNTAVRFKVRYLECWVAMGQAHETITGEVVTDNRGYFSIKGYRGTAITIVDISNRRYTFDLPKLYRYSHIVGPDRSHKPDKSNPEIFEGKVKEKEGKSTG